MLEDVNQKLAIETTEGPVLLIAGPGTGKTSTLIARIERLVASGHKPESILGLTFSEAAAKELRTRLTKALGKDEEEFRIFTFHGFAKYLMETYPDQFELPDNFLVLTEVDRFLIIREALESLPIEFLVTKASRDRYFYVKELSQKISTLKKEDISESEFMAAVAKIEADIAGISQETKKGETEAESLHTRVGKLRELWKVYEYYQARLAEMSAIDFEDMLGMALLKLRKDEAFRKIAANAFGYVLVDEYQDTNQAQNQLLFLITKYAGNDNVLAVGDDDQSVYGFQGASQRNVTDFLDNFPKAKIISLTSNFRSSQKVLDLAAEIIDHADNRLIELAEVKKQNVTKDLKALNPQVKDYPLSPQFMEFSSREQELSFLIDRIREFHEKQNLPFNEMAVLARTNEEGREISHALYEAGLPHAIGWSEDILQNPLVIRLLATLSAIYNPEDGESFFAYLLTPLFKVSLLDAVTIAERSKFDNLPMSVIAARLQKVRLANVFSLQKAVITFEKLRSQADALTPIQFVDLVVKTLDLKKGLGAEREISLQALVTFKDELETFLKRPTRNTLKDFVNHLNLAEHYRIVINSEKEKMKKDAISVLTAHSAKGTEFKTVFVTGLTSQRWEGRSARVEYLKLPQELLTKNITVSLSRLSEEIRLLYVAATRAKERLYMSYAVNNKGDQFYATTLLASSSQKKLLEQKEGFAKTAKNDGQLFHLKTASPYAKEIQKLVSGYKFSASGLKLFRDNRELFKYSYLYRLPEKVKISLVFGASLHECLKTFVTESIVKGSWLPAEFLFECFNGIWQASASQFPEIDHKAKEVEGLDCLAKTYQEMTLKPVPDGDTIGLEKRVEGSLDGIPIVGKVDRFEMTSDGIRVTDYKSGTPESENAIMGKTKSSDGATYDQLLFYKLLLEQNLGHPVVEGIIWYLQDPKKMRSFYLKDADTKELVNKIKEASDLMQKGNFEARNYLQAVTYYDEFPKLRKLGI
jgi:DNA helicase-2/ATP-dependent DNA helicase PcrA